MYCTLWYEVFKENFCHDIYSPVGAQGHPVYVKLWYIILNPFHKTYLLINFKHFSVITKEHYMSRQLKAKPQCVSVVRDLCSLNTSTS